MILTYERTRGLCCKPGESGRGVAWTSVNQEVLEGIAAGRLRLCKEFQWKADARDSCLA